MKKVIYLARFGKVHGPFSDTEIESFQANGKMLEFTWIWDYGTQAWRSLDPAPAPLFDAPAATQDQQVPAQEYRTAVPVHQPTGPTGPSPAELGFPASKGDVPVICHNFRQVVSGFAQKMTATGCELVAEGAHFSPTFVAKSPVILNLLDSGSGKQMNVSARVCGVTRSKDGWVYQVRWEQRPGLQAA